MSRFISDVVRQLDARLKSADFYTTIIPDAEGGQLVCASKRNPDGSLSGNSIRLMQRGEISYIATWTPRVYRIRHNTDLKQLVEECLEESDSAMHLIPKAICSRLNLEEVESGIVFNENRANGPGSANP